MSSALEMAKPQPEQRSYFIPNCNVGALTRFTSIGEQRLMLSTHMKTTTTFRRVVVLCPCMMTAGKP